MHKRIIEIEIECTNAQLPAAIQQVAQVVNQTLLPDLVRQVFVELPAQSQITLQLPNLAIQRTPLLENHNG